MPRTHRYNATEQKVIDLADRVIANPTATPTELTAAMRSLERVLAKAERRARDRAEDADWYPPAEPAKESVDDLVTALESKKTLPAPSKPPEVTAKPVEGPKLAEVIAIADGTLPKPAVLVPPEPAQKCWNCDQVGQPTWDERVLCPTHLASEAARIARQNATASLARQDPPARSWLYEKGETENTFDLSAAHGARTSDFAASVRIWEEQAREDSDRRAAEAREREAAEAQYHHNRANWIQNGGKL